MPCPSGYKLRSARICQIPKPAHRVDWLTLENAQPTRILSKIANRIDGLAASKCLAKVVETAIDHFHGKVRERPVENLSDIVGEVHQNGKQDLGCPNLKPNATL